MTIYEVGICNITETSESNHVAAYLLKEEAQKHADFLETTDFVVKQNMHVYINPIEIKSKFVQP